MRKVSEGKYQALVNMSNPDGIIGALAIDQRGALKKMMARHQEEVKVDDLIHFKELVSEELTPFASSILLDPEYGLPSLLKNALRQLDYCWLMRKQDMIQRYLDVCQIP